MVQSARPGNPGCRRRRFPVFGVPSGRCTRAPWPCGVKENVDPGGSGKGGRGGHLVMLERMDGTQLSSIDAAKDKAYSAVLYRRPTKVFQDLVGQGGANLRLLRLAGASPLEGGIPLMVDGKIVGAVGVSGATSEQDAQVAKAGADALTK